jgi:hypothetical protein
MGDWLGTGTVAPRLRQYRPFLRARAFARSLKLKSGTEWSAFCKGQIPWLERLPADIPASPNQTYADKGWKSWGDWLGTGTVASRYRQYRPFLKARAFVHKLRLKSVIEWSGFCKGERPRLGRLPADIPASPNQTYDDKGWKSWGDWLGTGTVAPRLRQYRPFHEARAFVHRLKLKSGEQWFAFCKGKIPRLGRLPADVPADPGGTYAEEGWKGMGDWLGTGTIAPSLRTYRLFREARAFARGLKLKGVSEWFAFCRDEIPRLGRLPADIPRNANSTYAHKGWVSWGDWLGTGTIWAGFRKHRPFREARAFVHKLKLKSNPEWRAFCKGEMPRRGQLPADIPTHADRAYADKGWKSWGDWLGTGTIWAGFRKYRPFREARAFARRLKLKSGEQWFAFSKGKMPQLGRLPADIPVSPGGTYADKGWQGMGDWLGTGNIANFLREYRPFREARSFARELKLKSGTEWSAFCKGEIPRLERLPKDIPASPNQTYADKGWRSWGDWLGTGKIATSQRRYLPFREARAFAHSLRLTSGRQWFVFCKGMMPHLGQLPADIPANARGTYADKGWKGMGDWLGTGNIANFLREYRPFREARAFVRSLKLKSETQWRAFCRGEMPRLGRLPADIPAHADRTYADKGWKGMGDWLGTGRIADQLKQYRRFREARAFARSLNLKSGKQWFAFCKGKMPRLKRLPADIPANPAGTYADKGWKGYGDWLGTDRKTRNRRTKR